MTTILSNFLCGAALPWLGYLVVLFVVWERPNRTYTAFFFRLSILFGAVCAVAIAVKEGAA